MARAQGSLEYLIIISIAIAIVAIVSMIMVNSFSQRQSDYVMASCASAASTCKSTLIADPTAKCDFCDTSCKYANGTEVFPSAATCCVQGLNAKIYAGATGCGPACSDGTPYGGCGAVRPSYCNPSTGLLEFNCQKCNCLLGAPVCKSDGKCVSQCTGTGCIADNKPWYCNGGALVQKCIDCNGCAPTTGCETVCKNLHVCVCCYTSTCNADQTCTYTASCDCSDTECGGSSPCPPGLACPT